MKLTCEMKLYEFTSLPHKSRRINLNSVSPLCVTYILSDDNRKFWQSLGDLLMIMDRRFQRGFGVVRWGGVSDARSNVCVENWKLNCIWTSLLHEWPVLLKRPIAGLFRRYFMNMCSKHFNATSHDFANRCLKP